MVSFKANRFFPIHPKKLSKEQMQEAFSVMQELFAPMEVTVAEIGLAKTNPHQDLIRVELND